MEVYKKVRAYIEGSRLRAIRGRTKSRHTPSGLCAMMNGEKPCTPMTCAQFVSP